MKILVVGGTGLLGGDVAVLLHAEGHEVTIGARKPAPAQSAMAAMPHLFGDYMEGGYSVDELKSFDGVIFAAGSDVRHIKEGVTEEVHWRRANAEATPAFFERARDAGVKRALLLGSFYPQAAPALVGKVPYVTGRADADNAVRALARDSFSVSSVNPPYVIGTLPGVIVQAFMAYTSYALGLLPFPAFAPAGGANFITTSSLSRALATAIVRGENGKAYLVGDENLSFQAYLEAYFRAAGRAQTLSVLDQEHPLFPDSILYAGRGGTIYFEPDEAERAFLGYERGRIRQEIEAIVAAYGPMIAAAAREAPVR
ncbi:MAG: nucleoside-diphosphate sugar epimerase [Bradyrhizobium sp.]|nr:nucleoside-diphosphate sugar epimerase [Bradyrhizobium sp.]